MEAIDFVKAFKDAIISTGGKITESTTITIPDETFDKWYLEISRMCESSEAVQDDIDIEQLSDEEFNKIVFIYKPEEKPLYPDNYLEVEGIRFIRQSDLKIPA
jgi:hypothetical protein